MRRFGAVGGSIEGFKDLRLIGRIDTRTSVA
jgi:hypothetical protein